MYSRGQRTQQWGQWTAKTPRHERQHSEKPTVPLQSMTVSSGVATGESKSLRARGVLSCQNFGEKSKMWASLKSWPLGGGTNTARGCSASQLESDVVPAGKTRARGEGSTPCAACHESFCLRPLQIGSSGADYTLRATGQYTMYVLQVIWHHCAGEGGNMHSWSRHQIAPFVLRERHDLGKERRSGSSLFP